METATIIITIIVCSLVLWFKTKKQLEPIENGIYYSEKGISNRFVDMSSQYELNRKTDNEHFERLLDNILNQNIETAMSLIPILFPNPVRFFLITYSFVDPRSKVATRGRLTLQTETFPNEQELRELIIKEQKIQYPIIDGLIEFKSESDYQTFIKVD